MYSTSSRTKRTLAASGSRSAIKNCRLCFSEYDEENELWYNQTISDLYCKYLHSSLTQELPIGSDYQPLCTRCIVSGKEIIALSKQMEIIQKGLSELVFMFSLEILHRRGKTIETQETTGKKLIEFDVSALPNCESWDNPSADNSCSSSETIIPENMFTQNAEDQIIVPEFVDHHGFNDVSTGEIKLETFESRLEDGIEDSCYYKEGATNPNMPYLTDTELLNNTQVLIKSENVGNSESSTCSENRLLNPILQVQELEIHSDRKQIIAEEDTDYFGFNNNQLSEGEKTVWNRRDSESSFKLTQQNSKPSLEEEGHGHLNTYALNSMSTPGALSSVASEASTSTFRISRRGKRITNASRLDQSKGKSNHHGHHSKARLHNCRYCPKGFMSTVDLVRHERTHTGEKPFKCDKCDFSSALRNNLERHKRRRHGHSGFKCKECGNNYNVLNDAKRHFKRTHFALDFSDDCVIATNWK